MSSIKEIDLHITDVCSGNCPMCYITEEEQQGEHGDLDTLKKIVDNALASGDLERFVLVGGDPCEHPNFMELLQYIKERASQLNVNVKTIVLSNTHEYKRNGQVVDMEEVAKYVDELDVTIHGSTAEEHDTFNRTPGSYEKVMSNIQKFAEITKGNPSKEIYGIVNVMPHTVHQIEQIMLSANERLNGAINGFGIQRIAPSGRADGQNAYFIQKIDVNPMMETLDKFSKDGFDIQFIDVFPWCAVKEEYRHMLPKGGCNWGDEVLAVFKDGSCKRCAMSANELSKNVLELDTEDKWINFLKTDPELIAFRKKAHLDEVCLECELLQDCGGSCVMSRITGDPYKKDVQMFSDKYDEFTSDANNKKTRSITDLFRAVEGHHVKTGHDYLRAKQGGKEDR